MQSSISRLACLDDITVFGVQFKILFLQDLWHSLCELKLNDCSMGLSIRGMKCSVHVDPVVVCINPCYLLNFTSCWRTCITGQPDVCAIDPRSLFKALKRELFQLPTLVANLSQLGSNRKSYLVKLSNHGAEGVFVLFVHVSTANCLSQAPGSTILLVGTHRELLQDESTAEIQHEVLQKLKQADELTVSNIKTEIESIK